MSAIAPIASESLHHGERRDGPRRDSCTATKSGSVNGIVGLEKHPDKTFIGRIERDFDSLGYHCSPAGLSVAKKTIENFFDEDISACENGGSVQPPLRLRLTSGAGSIGSRAGGDESLRTS